MKRVVYPDMTRYDDIAKIVASAKKIETSCRTKCNGPDCWDVCDWIVELDERDDVTVKLIKTATGDAKFEDGNELDIIIIDGYDTVRYGALDYFTVRVPPDAEYYYGGDVEVFKHKNRILVYKPGTAATPAVAKLYEF